MEDNKVGNIIYHEPENNFKKVNFEVIKNFDCMTIGLYCKIIALSAEWKLNINGLATVLDISKEKVKTSIQKLERDGFMKRVPVKNENGKFAGYSYHFYPLPLPMEERTMAGYKKNGVPENGGTQKMGYPENDIPNNNREINNNRFKENKEKKVDDKTSTKKRFIKPTVEEIDKYISEKGLHFDAEGFYDYYESKGWLVGKSPMKDWKAACRTWEHNRKSKDKKEEVKEEDEPINLPAGMIADQWKRIGLWMCVEIPSIAGKISPMDFYEMKKLVDGNSEQLRDILKDINEYVSENGSLDVLEFFREIVRSNEAGNGHE